MTDKAQKLLEDVERLCNAGLHNSIISKKNVLNTILAVVNDFKEEPVSESPNTESMVESYKQRLISQANGVKDSPLIDMCLVSYKHGINETLDTLNLSNVQRTTKNWKDPVSEDLEEAAENFAATDEVLPNGKVMINFQAEKAFMAGAKWQKEQFEKNRLAACDRQTEEEAEVEQDFVMGIIENEHRQPTFNDAIKYGMRLQKEKMLIKAIDAQCFGFRGNALFSFELPADNYLVGSEVKVIVIKKD